MSYQIGQTVYCSYPELGRDAPVKACKIVAIGRFERSGNAGYLLEPDLTGRGGILGECWLSANEPKKQKVGKK